MGNGSRAKAYKENVKGEEWAKERSREEKQHMEGSLVGDLEGAEMDKNRLSDLGGVLKSSFLVVVVWFGLVWLLWFGLVWLLLSLLFWLIGFVLRMRPL